MKANVLVLILLVGVAWAFFWERTPVKRHPQQIQISSRIDPLMRPILAPLPEKILPTLRTDVRNLQETFAKERTDVGGQDRLAYKQGEEICDILLQALDKRDAELVNLQNSDSKTHALSTKKKGNALQDRFFEIQIERRWMDQARKYGQSISFLHNQIKSYEIRKNSQASGTTTAGNP